jgi:hypothetical protein
MIAVSTAGDAGVAGPADSASGRFDQEAAWAVLKEEQTLRHKMAATQMADVRREHFITGYLTRTIGLRDSP